MDDWTAYYKRNPNNFSNWFPAIKDCGIDVPRSFIIDVPQEVMRACFMENHDEDTEIILDFVKKEILPVLSENNLFFFFMKNSTFSNKFDFNDSCKCRNIPFEIVLHLINICYNAELVGADGLNEIIIREFIGDWYYIQENIPCIYNGMPLRPEFRVFYDFDKRKVLYSVNYWDWDYCHESICKYNATDQIVYEHAYATIKQEFEERQEEVETLVSSHIQNVQLDGIWSVDILWDEQNQKYWLIDMAIAQTSAYWNGGKDNDS